MSENKEKTNEKKQKQKKQKVKYIDDGRTIADMSGLPQRSWTKKGTTASPKEILSTYWSAVKMMFKPMLVVIAFLLLAYLIVTLIFWAL